MKHFTVPLLCALIGLASACASPQSFNPFAKPDGVVLEVVTTGIGMVYPKEGDILYFRLYESGRLEYDGYPNQDPPKITSRNVQITRKHAQLSEDDVNELISLASQPDFLNAKDEYLPPVRYAVDAVFTQKIVFKH